MSEHPVLICSVNDPVSFETGPFQSDICPSGMSVYTVQATDFNLGADLFSVDFTNSASFYSYGFGLILFCYLTGIVGHLLLKPWFR